jgi:nucleoside-diphosphate-sugar epimerase
MTKTALILGASGKIGRHSAAAFRAAGWRVKSYVRADNDMTAAARGVDVIVNGLNPPNYHDWAHLIPEITAQVIAAARASGASVILPGNVYNFGATPGVWSEDTPQNASTRKGRIRIEMEQSYRASGVQTIVLRAGNFIDPDRSDDIMSLVHLRAIANGRLTLAGRADVLQAYCYLPDWAGAAVGLAEKRGRLQTFEDVPFAGHSFSGNDLRGILRGLLGRPVKISRFPWWVMTLASPVWELAREMKEMRYLWNTSHQLSGRKLARLLPDFQATDLRQVIAAALPPEVYPNQRVPRRLGVSAAQS